MNWSCRDTCLCAAALLVTTGAWAKPPEFVSVSSGPPSDAVVVFNGQGTDQLVGPNGEPCPWPVEGGVLVSGDRQPQQQGLWTRLHFADAQVHCEFQLPAISPEENREASEGNSGLYFHGLYELQIRNTIDRRQDDPQTIAGALYGYSGPLVHAVRPPGKWQTYDVVFHAPGRNKTGEVSRPGSITAFLNGVLVQDGTPFANPVSIYHPLRYNVTPYAEQIKQSLEATGCGPLQLQYHNSPVRFRNLWIRPLDDRAFDFGARHRPAMMSGGLIVSLVDHLPEGDRVVAQHLECDTSGNTSVANDTIAILKHSSIGNPGYYLPDAELSPDAWREIAYFKRSRDLGQTFTYTGRTPHKLDAITLKTGYGTNAVRAGAFHTEVSLQLFEVSGEPRYNDNGTQSPAGAAHGYPHRIGEIAAERDDYLDGETFRSLAIARGGRFPPRNDFGLDTSDPSRTDDEAYRGRLLRFDLTGNAEITLMPGRKYAFLILIDNAGPARGFTLANRYTGRYQGGHGIRREGDGAFPPKPVDPAISPEASENQSARSAALLPANLEERAAIPPGTRGFPDVDTHRDLYFVVEAAAPKTPADVER